MIARDEKNSRHGRHPAGVLPVALYTGSVMHARLKPFAHRFNYSVFNILIDIDRLEEAARQCRLFKVNAFAPVSFHEKDHGDKRQSGLSHYIRARLVEAGIKDRPDCIRLLCYPRIFGYVFNPISIYYCTRAGELIAMAYEVRNTFGERHIYVEAVRESQLSVAGLRQECEKTFHVSPFIAMNMRYFFRTALPNDKVTFRILEKDPEGPLLSATLKATRQEFTSKNLFKELINNQFLTLKVIVSIHFQAAKLWFKGAQFHHHPDKHKYAKVKNDPDVV